MKTNASRANHTLPHPADCLKLYEQMLRLRRFEMEAQRGYKSGRIPGFIHLYIGEEASAAGVCAHLRPDDWITSTHRGHGHALAKGVSSKTVMAELYGRATGCCGGRGGSMHLFDHAAGLFGTNGIVAGGLPAAVGAAISAKARGTNAVAVAFFGDGATSHGAFHESVNFAAVQQAPVIFICENNLYATATPIAMATRNTAIASRAAAYGLPGFEVDGNDVLAVWESMRIAVERARNGHGPTLLEVKTYRLVGHHEGDQLVGTYRTQDELDAWKSRCPIAGFRNWLMNEGLANEDELEQCAARIDREISEAVAFAESSPLPEAATVNQHVLAEPINPPCVTQNTAPSNASCVQTSYLDAVRDGIAEEMRRDPRILYFGEGIGERGGSFAHTKGLWQEFGAGRVVDTPISELAFTGAAAGASATGSRAVADLMFVEFLFEAASQVILQAAKWRYMSNGQMSAPVVLRAAIGAIKNAGPHHSGCYYPLYAQAPGLIIAVPSNPADAKGLMKTALRAADPVLFLDHKRLFGMKGPVPKDEYCIPFGQGKVVREGRDLTLVSCGEYVHRCLRAAQALDTEGIACEVIDLRTIVPLDIELILASAAKTGRVLVVDEALSMCGVGAEISARVMEEGFDDLDAPVGRLHPDPVSQPFSPPLEDAMVVSVEKIIAAAKNLVAGKPPIPRRPKASLPASQPGALSEDATEPPHASIAPAPKPEAPSDKSASPGVPVLLPNQDLTVTEATIVRWIKKAGDPVTLGEPIVEVETAKSVFAIESPATGVLAETLANQGATVAMTQCLGKIRPIAN
jgi:2-oxoisovalerate dehydrogenase E1 component